MSPPNERFATHLDSLNLLSEVKTIVDERIMNTETKLEKRLAPAINFIENPECRKNTCPFHGDIIITTQFVSEIKDSLEEIKKFADSFLRKDAFALYISIAIIGIGAAFSVLYSKQVEMERQLNKDRVEYLQTVGEIKGDIKLLLRSLELAK